MNQELPDVQAGFVQLEAEEPEIKLPTSVGSWRNQGSSRKTSTSIDCVDPNKRGKILQEMRIPGHLTCLLRNLYVGKLELDIKHWTGSKLGKEYVKAVYCHPAYLYTEYIMQNGSLDESPAGIKISRRNISSLRYADDTTLMSESEGELRNLLMRVKEGSEKAGLKLNIQKTKIMASSLITSWQIEGENVEAVTILFSWVSKSLQMVTAALKLKNTCSLERKL